MKAKRLLAVLLSLCLTAGTPMQAFAAQDSVINVETTETVAEEATAAAVTETVAEVVSEEAAEPEAEETVLETETATEKVSTEEAVTSSPESSVTEESVPSSEETLETEAVSEENTTSENVTMEETTEETTTEEETTVVIEATTEEETVVDDGGFIVKETTTSTAVMNDASGNYSLTVTIYDDTVTKYAEITGFTDKGTSTSYDVIIPATVTVNEEAVIITSIAASVFSSKTMIKSLLFEEGSVLETIGNYAFSNCSDLSYMDPIPNTVTSIGVEAFSNCVKLGAKDKDGNNIEDAELILSSSLTSIGERAFQKCVTLTKVVIPNTFTTLIRDGRTDSYNGPFTYCDNLTDISFEDGISVIPSYFFDGRITTTDKTTCMYLPDSITSIANYAFYKCSALAYIELPENIKSIGVEAFYGCTSLGTKNSDGELLDVCEIILPSGITTIGERAFEKCTSLEKVVIPNTFTTVGRDGRTDSYNGPFTYCDNLTDISFEDGITSIPSYLFDGTIVPITKSSTTGEYLYTISFTIPDSVTTIGDYAFNNHVNAVAINISENSALKQTGTGAFYNCSLLTYINLPDTLTTIGVESFYGCKLLGTKDSNGETLEKAEIFLPDGLTTIGERAFEKCTSVEKIVIPNTFTTVGRDGRTDSYNGPFTYCDNLTDITFEEGIDTIPAYMFDGTIVPITTNEVTEEFIYTISFTIPDSVTSIGESAFKNQVNATAVNIGDNSKIISIGNNAFYRCSLIEKINIPRNLTKIGETAFYKCTSLKDITIPDTVTSIGEYAFQDCTALENVEFEVNNLYTTTQKLGKGTFRNCESLTTMKFGNKIKAIPDETFYDCSNLVEVEFSHGITSIGKNIFHNCESLKALFIPASVSKINIASSELAYCYEQGLKIYVEDGESTAKTFAETNGWETEVGIYASEKEFPDPALLEQMLTQLYDKNLDTRLTLRELEKIVNVDLSGLGIKDMTGTQLFTSMETLDCSDNEISGLNTESWTLLTTLDCSGNQLADIDISKCPLTTLDCSNNGILVFGFDDVPTLTNVTLGNQNGTLATVYDETNDEYILPLEDIYGKKYDKTGISDTSDEDVKKPTNEGLVWYEAYDVPDSMTYRYTTTYGSGDTSVEAFITVVIPNAGITLTEKEYPDINFRSKIYELVDTNKNELISKTEERACTSLDVSASDIADLKGIARLVNLKSLNCSKNMLSVLDVSKNVKLETLDCSENDLRTLNISDNVLLADVDCSENELQTLDVSKNVALVRLVCAGNMLSRLDISANALLEQLECGSNRLAAIDISNNTKLDTLRSGKQEFNLLNKKYNNKKLVNLFEYDPAYSNFNVSDVVVYIGESAYTSEDYVQITDTGLIVDTPVEKVVYQYALSDFRTMNVTVNLVDEMTEEEIIVLKDIATLDIDAFSPKFYTGEATRQNIVIFDGVYMLREDLDYEVVYADNIEVGTARVTIKGIGNYTGSFTDTYDIVQEWNVTVKNIKDQTFQNKALEPKLTVKDGRKTLRSGRDYTVTYINNKDTGVATAVITGIGAYAESGVKEATFNIVECNIKNVSFSLASVTYNGSAQKTTITAMHNGYLEENKDYRIISYSKNTKAGKGKVTIKGIGNYTGTINKTFTISKLDIETVSDNNITINGPVEFDMTGAKASVTIKSGNYTLVPNVDYTLSYSKNKAVGTEAKVTIKGKGSCKGKITKTFEIIPKDIKDEASISVNIATAQLKDGSTLKPAVTIIQGKKKLREGENKDYILTYDVEKTKEKGVVAVTITGKNNYSGTVTKGFIIVGQLINKAKIKGLRNFEYDGDSKEQSEADIDVMLGKDEVPANCYELSYSDNTDIGKAVITATAIPENCNYKYGGSVSAAYKITPVKFKPSKSEERVTAVLDIEDGAYSYTGDAVCPDVLVYDTVRDVALVKDIDYAVSCKNNVKVGNKASVTVKGIKNYSGSIKLNFCIEAKDMSEYPDDFTVTVKNSAYTGKKINPRVTVTDNNTLLKLNKDYRLIIDQAVETDGFNGTIKQKGKYILKIEGIGNYCGELAEEYYLYVY